MCCHGYAVTFIMMSWIIQIGLFSLLSLRRLIYAWVPRGRLQSILCLNLRLPVPGNKPAMIINQRIFFFHNQIWNPNHPTRFSVPPVVFSALLALIFSCVFWLLLVLSHLKCICSLSSSSLSLPAQKLWCTQRLSQQLRAYSVRIFL